MKNKTTPPLEHTHDNIQKMEFFIYYFSAKPSVYEHYMICFKTPHLPFSEKWQMQRFKSNPLLKKQILCL